MQWTSCCRDRRRSCPSIAVQDDYLLVRDDDGTVIRVKLESARDLLFTIQDALIKLRGPGAAQTCAIP